MRQRMTEPEQYMQAKLKELHSTVIQKQKQSWLQKRKSNGGAEYWIAVTLGLICTITCLLSVSLFDSAVPDKGTIEPIAWAPANGIPYLWVTILLVVWNGLLLAYDSAQRANKVKALKWLPDPNHPLWYLHAVWPIVLFQYRGEKARHSEQFRKESPEWKEYKAVEKQAQEWTQASPDTPNKFSLHRAYLAAKYSEAQETLTFQLNKTHKALQKLQALQTNNSPFKDHQFVQVLKDKLESQQADLHTAQQELSSKQKQQEAELEACAQDMLRVLEFRDLVLASELVAENDKVLLELRERIAVLEVQAARSLEPARTVPQEAQALVKSLPEVHDLYVSVLAK